MSPRPCTSWMRPGKFSRQLLTPDRPLACQVFIFRVIEWQKRGLPHAHIAIKLNFEEGTNLFQFVSASVPRIDSYSDSSERKLHFLIMRNNVHANDGHVCTLGCTTMNPCRKEWNYYCNKFVPFHISKYSLPSPMPWKTRRFPKGYSNYNTFDDRGYPVYKRVAPEDRFVVPYHKAISLFWEGKFSSFSPSHS